MHRKRKLYPVILTKYAWSNQDLLHLHVVYSTPFFLRDTASNLEQARSPILPTLVANHRSRFGLSCALVELAK